MNIFVPDNSVIKLLIHPTTGQLLEAKTNIHQNVTVEITYPAHPHCCTQKLNAPELPFDITKQAVLNYH